MTPDTPPPYFENWQLIILGSSSSFSCRPTSIISPRNAYQMFASIIDTLRAQRNYGENHSVSSHGGQSEIDSEVESLRHALSGIYRNEDAMSIGSADCYYEEEEEEEVELYRSEYGRGLNKISQVYVFPADPEEKTRLYRQNQFIRATLGAYPPVVREILERDPADKAVLDLGCGDGTWIFEIANHFPLCRAVGVDLVPVEATPPDNFVEELWDINRGLEDFYGQYDVVHARLLSHGICDFPRLMDEMVRCLRPGGILILCEFDFKVYRSDRTLYYPWSPRQNDEPTSFLAIWFAILRNAIRYRGGTVDAPDCMVDLIRSHPYLDQSDPYIVERWFPFAPYPYNQNFRDVGYNQERQSAIGDMVRSDVLTFLKSGRVVLLMNGMSEEEAINLERHAQMELFEMRYPSLARLIEIHVRRRA